MESDKLYKITKKDFRRLNEILTLCFREDPLYTKLIPDADVRKRLMPELFKCDLEEMFSTCEIFSDSPALNSILVVSDESEAYNHFLYTITEIMANIKTDEYLIKEDPSLKTFTNFILGKEYLDSSWADELPKTDRIHIVYLAVSPDMQHHDIAAHLVREVINYADKNNLMLSLETHNEHNVNFYRHFGFELYEVIDHCLDLKQYCMIKRADETEENRLEKREA